MKKIIDKNLEDVLMTNFAHLSIAKKETIKEHADICVKYLEKFKNELIGEKLFSNIYNEKEISLLKSMIYLHDIGKINPAFQEKKMKNKVLLKNFSCSSVHSRYSAYLYLVIMLNGKPSSLNKEFLYKIFNYAYLIYRHHTKLINIREDFINDLIAIEDNEEWVSRFLKENNFKSLYEIVGAKNDPIKAEKILLKIPDFSSEIKNNIDFYIKNKIAYALLICCDYAASYQFFNNKDFILYSKLDSSNYWKGDLYQTIKNKKLDEYSENDINKLRTEMALSVEENLNKDKEQVQKHNIFELQMPCGAGKTNVGLLAGLKLLDDDMTKRGIIYTSPFNAITDQNVNFFKSYFKDSIQVINSTTDINISEDEEDKIEQVVLNYKMANYPFICTSHVHFFDALFGTSRESALNLLFLFNRVIVLDEIQGYDPNLWKIMITFINKYSKFMNFKILLMSATMPSFKILVDDLEIFDLLPNKQDYYNNPMFKNRINIQNIGKIDDLNKIIKDNEFYKNKKVLYEFQTKKTSRLFFEMIREKFPDKNIVELTGDSNSFERIKIINKAKEDSEIIVISTQVIEAGVDLDFDCGFKESSIPDSEIQFGGRINRSCKKQNCNAYFFEYGNYSVYKGDPRILTKISDPFIEEAIRNFDNIAIYSKALEFLNKDAENKSSKYNYDSMLTNCAKSNYDKIRETMELIENNSTLFIAHDLKIKKPTEETIKFFKDLNKNEHELLKEIIEFNESDIVLHGKRLWEVLNEKYNYNNFPEKFLITKKLNILKTYFSFPVYFSDSKKLPHNICQSPNNKKLFYTDDERYIIDGHINRKELQERKNFW